ncbi:hypothetical protein [Cutibacterium avidum]|uniref:hypothetical protein n=1 Tax=Cutibacterium avidum TaxID=33010 RepID=UPI00164D411A|nr:hypothetical protein [Cutibacterium avidum]
MIADTPLCTHVESAAQKLDAARACAAVGAARALTVPTRQADEHRRAAPSIGRGL